MKILSIFAVLALLGPALAHLQTPWLTLGDALHLGERLVLARVLGVGRPVGAGTETEVEVLADDGGATLRGPLTVWQEGHHHHDLEPGTLVFLPLARTPAGGWRYLAETRTPLRTRPGHRPIDEAFVRRWRTAKPLDLLANPDEWLALLDHPAPLARAVAFETLAARGPLLRPLMAAERLDHLLDPILLPEVPEADRLARLRLAEVMAGQLGADAVARRFDQLPGERVRSAAAGILARHPSPATRAVLSACARAPGTLGARCARLEAVDGPAQ